MSQIGTGKAPNRFFTMFLRFADWLGSARRENDDIYANAGRRMSVVYFMQREAGGPIKIGCSSNEVEAIKRELGE